MIKYRRKVLIMSQTSVASYFTTRKRVANEDIGGIRNKIRVLESSESDVALPFEGKITRGKLIEKITHIDSLNVVYPYVATKLKFDTEVRCDDQIKAKRGKPVIKTTVRPTRSSKKSSISDATRKTDDKQEKIVKFIKMGMLSPRKNTLSPVKQKGTLNAFSSLESFTNIDRGMKTPTKSPVESQEAVTKVQGMSIDEIKKKLSKSTKLNELKASIAKIQELDGKLPKIVPPVSNTGSPKLKEFKHLELEILSPIKKQFTSPHKLLPVTPTKYAAGGLMSPKLTPQKLLFTPTKLEKTPIKSVPTYNLVSPLKIPAYEKYGHLIENEKSGLQLPFKYRNLAETFKCCDSVCSMFHNRHETITFKKLKPAVQRMLRKNFNETNLAQIFHLYPEAYKFAQVKMRNFGSTTKHDHYQLVITPNVSEHAAPATMPKSTDDNVITSAQNLIMNPQIIVERQKHFNKMLTRKVMVEHENFLKTLTPPITVSRDRLKRWHPEFDLEKCPEIEIGALPQPPNIEKFSSAKDILSTARNLFNCATPMERAMERLDAKKLEEPSVVEKLETVKVEKYKASLLKDVPKSLLEKIRAKQAAKALDAMTRRPSQDVEEIKYRRLPDLARHIRNIFVTERKSVLSLDIVLAKLSNSYRGILTTQEFEEHMRLMSTELPIWIQFLDVRNSKYIKIARDFDINKIIEKLQKISEDKSK